MNKNQQKMVAYGRIIDNVMGQVEQLQDRMSPEFEELRAAIDNDSLADIDAKHYEDIRKDFAAGTADYGTLLKMYQGASAPARLMGNHILLTKAFAGFVDGCQAMTDSLGADKQIDVAAFNASEKKQDAQTELITRYLQKIQTMV